MMTYVQQIKPKTLGFFDISNGVILALLLFLGQLLGSLTTNSHIWDEEEPQKQHICLLCHYTEEEGDVPHEDVASHTSMYWVPFIVIEVFTMIWAYHQPLSTGPPVLMISF